MSLDFNMNKEPLKEKRKIKLMPTSSDTVISNLLWFKTSKIRQKDLNILSRDISTLKKMRFSMKLKSGSNMLKKERLHIMDLSATTIITGVIPSKNLKLSIKLCLRKPLKNLKNNWTNFQNPHIRTLNKVSIVQRSKRKKQLKLSQKMKTLKKLMCNMTRINKQI